MGPSKLTGCDLLCKSDYSEETGSISIDSRSEIERGAYAISLPLTHLISVCEAGLGQLCSFGHTPA